MKIQNKDLQPSKEQLIYANILMIGVWAGIILLTVNYFIYVAGLLPTHIEISQIPNFWSLGVDEYIKATNSPRGWGWVAFLSKGDFLNYTGLAFLALLTIVCYLVLVKSYYRQKDWLFMTIAVLEIIVLSAAASGIFGAGGH